MASDKDELWKELKTQWAVLKRGSGASEADKGKAKERINEIQEKLGVEKTSWDQPRQPGSHLIAGGNGAASGTGSIDLGTKLDKILGALLDTKREVNERITELTKQVNGLEAKVS